MSCANDCCFYNLYCFNNLQHQEYLERKVTMPVYVFVASFICLFQTSIFTIYIPRNISNIIHLPYSQANKEKLFLLIHLDNQLFEKNGQLEKFFGNEDF